MIGLLAGACVASPDESATEQADWDGSNWDGDGEVIVVEGGGNGWDAGWWFPGPGDEGPVEPSVPGGNGGGGKPPPKKPPRKDCTDEADKEACEQCCWYNYTEVDGYDCRKIRDPVKAEACWRSIFPAYSACLLYCARRDPGILTTSLPSEHAP